MAKKKGRLKTMLTSEVPLFFTNGVSGYVGVTVFVICELFINIITYFINLTVTLVVVLINIFLERKTVLN